MKFMRTPIFSGLAALLALAGGAFAQANNGIPGPTNYASFSRFITDRNIFDPGRQPHYYSATTRNRPRTRVSASAPAFTLVGTMSYEKGMFAFFSGNNADLKKVLPVAGKIADYTVTEITMGHAVLQATNAAAPLPLKVGDVVRQENGKWGPSGASEQPAGSSNGSSNDSGSRAPAASGAAGGENAAASEPASPASAGEPNDILKRLMEKREQENK
jgi:hypothetical protein